MTRLVASLLDPSSASTQALQETDDWLLLDVQARRGGRAGPTTVTGSQQSSASTAGKKDAIVFVVGGGSYVEYANLQEYAMRTAGHGGGVVGSAGQGRRITYGSTEILTPQAFVKALEKLAG